MLRLVTPSHQPLPPRALEEDDALLALAAPLAGESVLVLDRHAIGLMGALLRAGCREAVLLDTAAKPEAAHFDIVLVPDLAPGMDAALLCQAARRALVQTGLLVIRIAGADAGRRAVRLARALRDAGFLAPRVVASEAGTLLRVTLPAFTLRAAV